MTTRTGILRGVRGGSFAAVLLTLLAACAANRLPPKELNDAREEVAQARGTATQLDPTDVHEAYVALSAAETAWQEHPDSPSTIDLALIATRRAQIAEAEARVLQAQQRTAAADKQREMLAEANLQNARGRLGQTERQLGSAQQQLARQQQQSAEQREKLAKMEASLANARRTISKIASVKDNERGMVITLQSEILFRTGQSSLRPAAMARLHIIADALKGAQEKIHVLGYTDNVGTRDNNLALSELRADSVRDYLIGQGVPADLLVAEGKGPDDPVADNTSIEGRAANRRVEIVVEPGPKPAP